MVRGNSSQRGTFIDSTRGMCRLQVRAAANVIINHMPTRSNVGVTAGVLHQVGPSGVKDEIQGAESVSSRDKLRGLSAFAEVARDLGRVIRAL